jgi:hypothetical protein
MSTVLERIKDISPEEIEKQVKIFDEIYTEYLRDDVKIKKKSIVKENFIRRLFRKIKNLQKN